MISTKDIVFFLCLNERGGAEISMIRLAEGLRKAGRPVSLIVYGTKPHFARELGFKGEINDLHRQRSLGAIWPLIMRLRKKRPAFMISALTHTNMAALIASFFVSTHVIATEHGVDGVEACATSPRFARRVRFLYGRATALVAVSQGLADRWRSFVRARHIITTIYNPVVENIDAPVPPAAHEWLRDKTVPVVIGMGRLRPEKNFDLLLRAFAEMQKTKPARLVLLGEGTERAALEQRARELNIADKILLPGFVADTRAWLGHADLLVCPSRREGFGNALVEALACGVPVVSTDCPYGPAEILQRGRFGQLVPMDDVAAMADAMRASLESIPDVKALRARAGDFTVQGCIDAYAALVDNPSLFRGSR